MLNVKRTLDGHMLIVSLSEMQKILYYLYKFEKFFQQIWFSGKTLARAATVLVIWAVVSGLMLHSDLVEAQTVSFTNPSETVVENHSSGKILIPIELSTVATEDVTVTFSTIDGAAVAGEDFVAPIDGLDDTVTIATGEKTGTIQVLILPDLIDEPAETFTVKISNAKNAILSATAASTIITIDDDNAPPVIQISRTPNSAIEESDVATYTYSIVTDSTNTTTMSAQDIDIYVALTESGDYYDGDPINFPPVTLLAGQTSVDKSVYIDDDEVDETNGSITLTIEEDLVANNPAHYMRHATNYRVTTLINDNDVSAGSAGQVVKFTDTAISAEEGDGMVELQVEIVGLPTTAIDVTFETSLSGTGLGFATAGHDFTALTSLNSGENTVTIPTTRNTATIQIPILQDTIDEPDETFRIEIINVTAGGTFTTTDYKATITILDDDDAPVILVSRVNSNDLIEGAINNRTNFTYSIDTTTSTATSSAFDIEIQVNVTETGGNFVERGSHVNTSKTVTLEAGQTTVNDIYRY